MPWPYGRTPPTALLPARLSSVSGRMRHATTTESGPPAGEDTAADAAATAGVEARTGGKAAALGGPTLAVEAGRAGAVPLPAVRASPNTAAGRGDADRPVGPGLTAAGRGDEDRPEGAGLATAPIPGLGATGCGCMREGATKRDGLGSLLRAGTLGNAAAATRGDGAPARVGEAMAPTCWPGFTRATGGGASDRGADWAVLVAAAPGSLARCDARIADRTADAAAAFPAVAGLGSAIGGAADLIPLSP